MNSKMLVRLGILSVSVSSFLLAAEVKPVAEKVEKTVEKVEAVKPAVAKIEMSSTVKTAGRPEKKVETQKPKKNPSDVTAEEVIVYTQITELEKKLDKRIKIIKDNLEEKIKVESREYRRKKIEEIDNVKNLKAKLVSDYEAYIAELKKQSNELKANRYMQKEFEEIQKAMVELTRLHKENQLELKQKLQGLINDTVKTDRMVYLDKLINKQTDVMKKLDNNFNNIRSNHINHKNMLKDTFYVDLENLKRKYHNDNVKLQELFKINTNELVKQVDERKEELKLDYWEGK